MEEVEFSEESILSINDLIKQSDAIGRAVNAEEGIYLLVGNSQQKLDKDIVIIPANKSKALFVNNRHNSFHQHNLENEKLLRQALIAVTGDGCAPYEMLNLLGKAIFVMVPYSQAEKFFKLPKLDRQLILTETVAKIAELGSAERAKKLGLPPHSEADEKRVGHLSAIKLGKSIDSQALNQNMTVDSFCQHIRKYCASYLTGPRNPNSGRIFAYDSAAKYLDDLDKGYKPIRHSFDYFTRQHRKYRHALQPIIIEKWVRHSGKLRKKTIAIDISERLWKYWKTGEVPEPTLADIFLTNKQKSGDSKEKTKTAVNQQHTQPPHSEKDVGRARILNEIELGKPLAAFSIRRNMHVSQFQKIIQKQRAVPLTRYGNPVGKIYDYEYIKELIGDFPECKPTTLGYNFYKKMKPGQDQLVIIKAFKTPIAVFIHDDLTHYWKTGKFPTPPVKRRKRISKRLHDVETTEIEMDEAAKKLLVKENFNSNGGGNDLEIDPIETRAQATFRLTSKKAVGHNGPGGID